MDSDRRSWLRFETVLPVTLDSPGQAPLRCIARNVSKGGLCLELRDPLPLDSRVRVWFTAPNGCGIAAWGVVKNHYVFNYFQGRHRQLRGIGVRFESFEAAGDRALNKVLSRLSPN